MAQTKQPSWLDKIISSGIFNPATSPLNLNNLIGNSVVNTGESIAGGVKNALQQGVGAMANSGVLNPAISQSMMNTPGMQQEKTKEAKELASAPSVPWGGKGKTNLAPFMDAANSAANMGGIASGLIPENTINTIKSGINNIEEPINNAKNVEGGLQSGHIGMDTTMPEPNVKPPITDSPIPEYAYDNTKSQPIVPNAESLPPFPKAPIDTTIPAEPEPLPQGPGKTINRVNLPASVYGAGNEAQVQNTIDQYVPGNTAEEQYKNLQPTLDNFGKQIDYQIAKQPQSVALHDVMTNYDSNLEKAGVYRTSASSRGTLQATAQKYVRQLSGVSNDEGEVTSQSLASSLKKVNSDAGPVFKKIENGSKLTPQDEVILAARQTVRDTLTNMYGGKGGIVDTLMQKQGDLYDAADSLHAGRAAEFKATNAKTGITPKGIMETGAGLGAAAYGLKQLGVDPLALGRAGIELGKEAINNVGNVLTNKQTKTDSTKQPAQGNQNESYNAKISHISDIPQSIDKVNPDDGVTNPYSLKDANNNQVMYSQTQAADLTQQAEDLKLKGGFGHPASYYTNSTAGQQQLAAIEAKIKSKADLGAHHDPTQTQQLWSKAQEAKQLLKGAPLNLLNTFPDYNKLATAYNGKYRKLAIDLQMIEKYSGQGTLFAPQTNDAALSALDGAEKNFLNDYNQKLIAAGGGGSAGGNLNQVATGNQTPQPYQPTQSMPDISNMWGSTTTTPQDTLHNVSMPNLP